MKQEVFENKIKPALLWMGTIVACVMAVAYIVIVFVLIEGFKASTLLNTTLFSIVTAVIGFCIMQMLKIQGQSFAANLDENIKISKQYYGTKTKDKKSHSMTYYWIKSGLMDVLTRCLTLGLMSVGMIYIIIEGTKDYSLLFLAGVNLLMFAGFGLIGLVKTYDFYNDSFVPYMLEKIEEARELEEEAKRLMELAKEESNKQANDSTYDIGRVDLLESTDCSCLTSNM